MGYELRYFEKLGGLINEVEIKDSNDKSLSLEDAFSKILEILRNLKDSSNKLIFIGNGGSAAIASHQAIDYWKNGGIPAVAFNDASLLTCIGNDYGYEFVFEKPINILAKNEDVLIAISSSGASKNILNGVKSAKKKGLLVITLSGFSKSNPLRNCGDLNFYVPSKVYGFVEITHLAICHAILDAHMDTPI
jgi:D-sedoheptulose 7-phosphate isomerase